MILLDPEPPSALQVTSTTTTNVKMQWEYDNSQSAIKRWRLLYSEKDKEEFDELITDDVAQREVTIENLIPGQTYAIRLFAVSLDDIASLEPAEVTVTLSTYSNRHTHGFSIVTLRVCYMVNCAVNEACASVRVRAGMLVSVFSMYCNI